MSECTPPSGSDPLGESIDAVLSGIETEHTISEMNDTVYSVTTPDGTRSEYQASDLSVLQGGELLLYRAYPCPHGGSHAHQHICVMYARGHWATFERVGRVDEA